MGKRGPKEKSNKAETKAEIREIIEEQGEWNINWLLIAKNKGIPKTTFYTWVDEVINEIGILDMSKFGREAERIGLRNLKICNKLILQAKSKHETSGRGFTNLQATINLFNSTLKQFTEFQESYGHKPKVAEKLEVSENNVFDILAENLEEINAEKSVSKNSKRKKRAKAQ